MVEKGGIHLNFRIHQEERYFIGFYSHGSSLAKQLSHDDYKDDLARSSVEHPLGMWHEIEIRVIDDTITFIVNGVEEWIYRDPNPALTGVFGFEALDDSIVYLDDVYVYGPAPDPRYVWKRLGGPLGGLGYDIRMKPDNPDIMFVTDAYAGIYKSTDGGKSWLPANNGITTRAGNSGDAIPVFSLTIDPNNHEIIWVGTQDKRGIFKSTDCGESWIEMINGIEEKTGITFRGFSIDPTNSDTVYAAGEVSSWLWAGEEQKGMRFDKTKGVVYKTINGGANWKVVWRGDNLARYIWIDPTNTDILYVSTGIFDREAANTDTQSGFAGGVGITKSTDGGKTWITLNEENGLEGLYIGSLFMHPENPAVLIAGAGHDFFSRYRRQESKFFSPAGVFLTIDSGKSWTKTLESDLISSVEFSLSNPEIVFAAGDHFFYRSEDGGYTWKEVSAEKDYEQPFWGPPGILAGFPIDIQVDPRNPYRLFVNNYGGGNFLSIDGGSTWIDASIGYTGAMIRHVSVDRHNPAIVYAGGRSGLFRSDDGGEAWTGLAFPPVRHTEINAFAISPEDSNLVINGPWDIGIQVARSEDGGFSWKRIDVHCESESQYLDIQFAPSNTSIIYAGRGKANYKYGDIPGTAEPGDGVYVSRDAGFKWLPAMDKNIEGKSISCIAVHPKEHDVVYAGSLLNGLFKTEDGGKSWKRLSLKEKTVYSIAVNPLKPNNLAAGTGNGVYRSQDGGNSWKLSSKGIDPGADIRDIVFNPVDTKILWCADFMTGVYQSTDGGESWINRSEGLRTRAVHSLAISHEGLYLYAGTEGEGVFRLDLTDRPPATEGNR